MKLFTATKPESCHRSNPRNSRPIKHLLKETENPRSINLVVHIFPPLWSPFPMSCKQTPNPITPLAQIVHHDAQPPLRAARRLPYPDQIIQPNSPDNVEPNI